ncbi:MAG: bacillithiol biosynthesis cysteine-adding enzyme BshC [Saprospiraceae bacterium]|nr:bacillithiol biosynthesis cysteine-adding enzyme BshC [Saprospiraceae bacterium]
MFALTVIAQKQFMPSTQTLFQTEHLPIEQVLSLQPVVRAYLNESEKASELVSDFLSVDAIGRQIERKQSSTIHRPLLVDVLKRQYAGFVGEEVFNNIHKLAEANCFTLVTAHQPNLMGGPLYFIQKAVSAIKAAALCAAEYPNHQFVPVYWLGSEDHDFEELNHFHAFGQSFRWSDQQGGAVGRYSVNSLETMLAQVVQHLGSGIHAEALKNLLQKAYQPGNTMAQANKIILHELLGQYGLVVIDGDDVDLKRLMIPFFQADIENNTVATAIQPSLNFIHQEFGHSQAHARAINIFYLTNKHRGRIEATADGRFAVLGSEKLFSKEALLQELEAHPERFSPNVMLRPVMQEVCLPNLMYIGGGGESAYWLQLKAVFDAFLVPFPLIAVRDTAVYIDSKTKKKLDKVGLTVEQALQPYDQLVKAYVQSHTEKQLELSPIKQRLQTLMNEMQDMAKDVDITLKASAAAEAHRMQKSISNLEKKMLRAEKRNHDEAIQQIKAIQEQIFPKGKLQERYLNFMDYYLAYGKHWIDWMMENFNLFDKQIKVFIEKH